MKIESSQADSVQESIAGCLNLLSPKSFFLYAGAGSGKTRTLINALASLRRAHGGQMRLHGQRVAVITYTNAACDEIRRRLGFDSLVVVRTIHSFAWEEIVQGYTADIRLWLRENIAVEIADIREKQKKGRAGKASDERERSLASKSRRLESLDLIKRFTYNPNGDNRERDSLSHAEVIKISAAFLESKVVMQEILVRKFPFLLIDESQDTNKLLMEALLLVQSRRKEIFALGLFGDTMQRIYADGKIDLGEDLPMDWEKPGLVNNFRCPRRVIELVNQVRSAVDDHQQIPCEGAGEGHIRLFICKSDNPDRQAAEREAKHKMAELTADPLWREAEQVKTLTLEHHMAATRMGFGAMFEPLYQVDRFRTGLLDGSLPAIHFFSGLLLPLKKALQADDRFNTAAIVRRESPLLGKAAMVAATGEQSLVQLQLAKNAIDELSDLWAGDKEPTFWDVLRCVERHGLFALPDVLFPFASEENAGQSGEAEQTSFEESEREALHSFLATPFSQIEAYATYVQDEAPFGTHQGVKGLEFPRVMVVADDESSRGFLFGYEKLFGVKAKTATDIRNEKEGKETGIERTRRLFYVTCSRAEESLAIVAYTADAAKLRKHVIDNSWFNASEIELI